MPHPGEMLGGRYRLDDPIAAGGMGEVWQATDTVLGRPVAVKTLLADRATDPGFQLRFRHEARALAALRHPGVVPVYDFGSTEAQDAYLVMAHVDGRPLNHVLADRGRLDPAETMAIVAQAARALETAHTAGIVHRDVKPGNLIVEPDGTVVLVDFGVARSAGSATLTGAREVVGTALYIAPEQVTRQETGPAADVYALGALAYHCLAGHPPFDGPNPIAVALQHIEEVPPPLPQDVPAEVSDLVRQAMAKDPAARFPSAGAMADAAADLRAAIPATSTSAGHADGRTTVPVTTTRSGGSDAERAVPDATAPITAPGFGGDVPVAEGGAARPVSPGEDLAATKAGVPWFGVSAVPSSDPSFDDGEPETGSAGAAGIAGAGIAGAGMAGQAGAAGTTRPAEAAGMAGQAGTAGTTRRAEAVGMTGRAGTARPAGMAGIAGPAGTAGAAGRRRRLAPVVVVASIVVVGGVAWGLAGAGGLFEDGPKPSVSTPVAPDSVAPPAVKNKVGGGDQKQDEETQRQEGGDQRTTPVRSPSPERSQPREEAATTAPAGGGDGDDDGGDDGGAATQTPPSPQPTTDDTGSAEPEETETSGSGNDEGTGSGSGSGSGSGAGSESGSGSGAGSESGTGADAAAQGSTPN